ncbi:site-2 protease family protein [Aporhodopirellula aestuarii]|uniref:Zinc metalloprotease n=1 Tax=Aporhodopirellula aestuarii TaxID=2950107 RepID=A0ABT0UBL0_9BACT|nr:site-2 protease family protein [Aporhodopirellula aestuarii]MCM2374397.1 site-2 protease family protein [Aporhodopirellula aestuarii]
MNGSWHLGRFAGIDVRLHWTFLLLPLWIYFSNLASGNGTIAALGAVLMIFAVFACVLLHEFGHALTARRFGISTRDITLLPIGGVASLEDMPREPWKELAIAIAGPFVNVVIAASLFAGLWIANPVAGPVSFFISQLAIVNVALVVFNMLPAFPMDGGRVLRAILAMKLPYLRATVIAARVGQCTAAGFGLLGLIGGNLLLVFIAGFIVLAAQGESIRVRLEGLTSKSTAASQEDFVWESEVTTPYPNESSEAVKARLLEQTAAQSTSSRSLPVISTQWNSRSALGWLGKDSLDEFLVSSGGSVIGMLGKSDLRHAVRNGRGAMTIDRLLASGACQLRPVA